MKLRVVNVPAGKQVQALSGSKWRALASVPVLEEIAADFNVQGSIATDLLAALNLGEHGFSALADELSKVDPHTSVIDDLSLPFTPKSFRDFMLYERHVIDSTRAYVKRFMPQLYPVTQAVEKLTGKPFRRFRPHKLWYRQPIYYFGNHLNFCISGDDVTWPNYSEALEYELEVGAVLSKPLINASAEEAVDAIGGFVVLNDFSARDVQKLEMDSGFGPQKAKHFASAMSAIVVTTDELLPVLNSLTASVAINGIEVAKCSTQGAQFSLADAISFASTQEQLHVGELFGSGTLPGGSGLENGNWLSPGDELSLKIDQIGEVTNQIHRAH